MVTEEKLQIPHSEQPYPYYAEDEIDLSELLAVLWRRKMTIMLTTIGIAGLALIFCLISTKQYLVTAQITPGVSNYNNEGDPIRLMTTNDLEGWFDKEAYLTVLKGILNEEELRRVKIGASAPRGSNVVSLELYWPEKKKGEEILDVVLDSMSNINNSTLVLGKSLQVPMSIIEEGISRRENSLKQLEIEKEKLEREIQLKTYDLQVAKESIKAVEEKFVRTSQLINDLSKELRDIKKNTGALISLRNELAKRSGADKLSLLMYTNIIQQNISYNTQIRQQITNLNTRIVDLELSKNVKQNKLKKIEDNIKTLQVKKDQELPLKKARLKTEIATLTAKKAALSPIEVVQAPFSSLRPVKPKTVMIVTLGVVVGAFMGIFMAFILEFISSNREKITGTQGRQ
ncbi:LPS O-antigen chain length determinant protein, WzzB/FepE family [Desulfacinum hydrothermale DSM 13146]|uniref:LPS O-antigen chain length determinant protein, WzzB/FepE family n=1 Tax=Desulfacinum hydrothermale DSM 13146 TaxID=1121390 RepID=A0A1W1XSJ8_9BACT|nr:Wzz/FepE/Etk N-terminal domain-containing protein [Desulfacinum hydrothermale]SMC26521.1 LPS O-antigen chain length determinant protein, WzzB/FepE family [Desulfacinum hydrothermale DSM 13146]